MLLRLLIVAAVLTIACKAIFGKYPWEYLMPPPTQAQKLFKARKLLGIGADASHAEIVEAHRRLIGIVHPDRGGTSEQVHEANAARDLLLAQIPPRG